MRRDSKLDPVPMHSHKEQRRRSYFWRYSNSLKPTTIQDMVDGFNHKLKNSVCFPRQSVEQKRILQPQCKIEEHVIECTNLSDLRCNGISWGKILAKIAATGSEGFSVLMSEILFPQICVTRLFAPSWIVLWRFDCSVLKSNEIHVVSSRHRRGILL